MMGVMPMSKPQETSEASGKNEPEQVLPVMAYLPRDGKELEKERAKQLAQDALEADGGGTNGKLVIAGMAVVSLLLTGLIIWLVMVTHQTPQ